MSADDGPNRLIDETQRLLANEDDHSHQQPGSSIERSVWIQYLSYASHAAKVALNFNKIYVLFIFVPLGFVAGAFSWNPVIISIVNLLAIIPLSALVSYSADLLSDHVGESLGELINATFGNVVELIVGILALLHNDIRLVQSVMLGSILSDILLVLGGCLFVASYNKQTPTFNRAQAGALSSMMIVTTTALILPTALYSTFISSGYSNFEGKVLAFSRGSSAVLFTLYIMYLYFQLRTHDHLFLDVPEDEGITSEERNVTEEQQAPTLNPYAASAVLIAATVGIMGCSHQLLDSINKTAKVVHTTKTFIAAIIIPIASNAPECASIAVASLNGRMNFAIGVIVGSILQIALFVIPFLVILGWIIQQPMTLYFEAFQTAMLFFAVLVVNRLLQDGKYTYIQGAMLVSL